MRILHPEEKREEMDEDRDESIRDVFLLGGPVQVSGARKFDSVLFVRLLSDSRLQ